jgi:hypothetical protein
MANYTFLDATGATITAASSTIGAVEYPIVKVNSVVGISGTVQVYGPVSIVGIVNINSVIGTYADDTQHSTSNPGFLNLGVRNDTLSSVTSLDNDYTPPTVGPMGEAIVANAPITKWVRGTASITTTATPLQPIIAAQGASIFAYISAIQISNWTAMGSVLLALQGATASTIGYALVAANDMAVINYPNPIKTLANADFTVSIVAGVSTASIFIAAQGFISKT